MSDVYPLKEISADEYHSADGRFVILRNTGIKKDWALTMGGWLVYRNDDSKGTKGYLAWANSIQKSAELIEVFSMEVEIDDNENMW